jgi:hypothetical protein
MNDFNYAWLLPALLVALAVLLTTVFRLEKRMVWPFGEIEASPQFSDPASYGARWAAEAQQAGWRMLGWSRDMKFAQYRIYYALMISPDQSTLAVIGAGMLSRLPLKATWLYTPLADGRTIYSTDNQTGVSIDLSGNWRSRLSFEPSFTQLWRRHQEWIAESGVPQRLFRHGHELDDLRAIRHEHFWAMERAGLVKFTDASSRYFQFTLAGAAKTAAWSYVAGVMRGLSKGQIPKTV